MEQQEPRGAPPRSHHNSMGPCMTWLFPGLEEEDVGTAPGPQAGMMCLFPCCKCTSPPPMPLPTTFPTRLDPSTAIGTGMLWSGTGIWEKLGVALWPQLGLSCHKQGR